MFNKKYIIGFLLIICVMATFCGCTSYSEYAEQLKEQNPPENYKELYTDTESHDTIYDYVGADAGVHYVVYKGIVGRAGYGGITPRYNADGTLMVTR